MILDAVFPQAGFRTEAAALAARWGARYAPIWCVCSDETLWRARLADRIAYVPGWEPVGWAEVERLHPLFLSWPPAAALCLDAVHPVATNLAIALNYVKHDR